MCVFIAQRVLNEPLILNKGYIYKGLWFKLAWLC